MDAVHSCGVATLSNDLRHFAQEMMISSAQAVYSVHSEFYNLVSITWPQKRFQWSIMRHRGQEGGVDGQVQARQAWSPEVECWVGMEGCEEVGVTFLTAVRGRGIC